MAAMKARYLSNENQEKGSHCAGQASCAIGSDRDLSRIEIHTCARVFFFYHRFNEHGSGTLTISVVIRAEFVRNTHGHIYACFAQLY